MSCSLQDSFFNNFSSATQNKEGSENPHVVKETEAVAGADVEVRALTKPRRTCGLSVALGSTMHNKTRQNAQN